MDNTNFGSAKFIIDDTRVDNIKTNVFTVVSAYNSVAIKGIYSLKKGQKKILNPLGVNTIVTVNNNKVKYFIHKGASKNNGSPQQDSFLIDKDGNINQNTPIIWDFAEITNIKALPVNTQPITIRGGKFTTVANSAESKYTYYARGITIQ